MRLAAWVRSGADVSLRQRRRAGLFGLGMFVLLVGSMSAAAQPSSSHGLYVSMTAEAWSRGLPVMDLEGDWGAGYERSAADQRAYAMARAEAGAWWRSPFSADESRPWRLGLLVRADASARMTGEAAQVLYHYQSRTDPSQPVVYNADTRIQFWRGHGMALHAPALRLGGLQLDLGWDHMTLQRMRDLQTRGTVGYNVDQSYSYQGTLRDDDSQTRAIFMNPPATRGVGDALSLSLNWERPQADQSGTFWPGHIKLQVDDAWSRLRWSGVNGNDAVLDSQVSQRTPEGYIEYRAAINGQYTRKSLVERIPVTTQFELGWPNELGEWQLRWQERLGLWQRWVAWRSTGDLVGQFAIEPTAGAWQIGLAWHGFNASFMADRLDRAAHARGVQLSWLTPL